MMICAVIKGGAPGDHQTVRKPTWEAVDLPTTATSEGRHFGQVHSHPQGAVSAQKSQLSIDPGSMRAESFIVRGLGNPGSVLLVQPAPGGRLPEPDQAKRS